MLKEKWLLNLIGLVQTTNDHFYIIVFSLHCIGFSAKNMCLNIGIFRTGQLKI